MKALFGGQVSRASFGTDLAPMRLPPGTPKAGRALDLSKAQLNKPAGLPSFLQGGGNPFDMKNLMESVKKAQQMVQLETARVQSELAA